MNQTSFIWKYKLYFNLFINILIKLEKASYTLISFTFDIICHTFYRFYLQMLSLRAFIEKNEIMPFAATWIGLEIIMLSEVSQTKRDKYHVITYMWNLKK